MPNHVKDREEKERVPLITIKESICKASLFPNPINKELTENHPTCNMLYQLFDLRKRIAKKILKGACFERGDEYLMELFNNCNQEISMHLGLNVKK